MKEVTDPTILGQLNGSSEKEVKDPALIGKLEGAAPKPAEKSGMFGSFAAGAGETWDSTMDAFKEFISTPEGREKITQLREARQKQLEQTTSEHPIARKVGEFSAGLAEAVPAGVAAVMALPEEAGLGLGALAAGGAGALTNMAVSPTGQKTASDFMKAKGVQGIEGGIGGALGEVGGRALTTLARPVAERVAPQVKEFADIAKSKFGLHVSAGNQVEGKTGETIRNLENSGKFAVANQQKAQQAIAKELGVNSNRLDERTLNTAYQQANSAYNKLTSDKPVKLDKQFFTDMSAVLQSEKSGIPSLRNKQLEQTIDELKKTATTSRGGKTGELLPRQYQDLRSKLNDKAQAAFAARDGGLGKHYKNLVEKLDDSVERNIPPAQKEAWADARNKWRAWSVVRELAGKGDIDSGTGQVNMKSFSDHIRQEKPDQWGKHTGGGDTFTDLAKIADTFPNAFQSTLRPKNLSPQEEMARMVHGVSPTNLASKAAGKVAQVGANTEWGQKNLLQGTPLGQSMGTVSQKYPGLIPAILRSLGITSTEQK